MKHHFARIAEGVYALAVWDDSWDSYNNCYIVRRDDRAVLIDVGKSEHVDILTNALATLHISKDDVSAVIATHRHHDHTGGSLAFPAAKKFIHPADWRLLPEELQAAFAPTLPPAADPYGLDCVWLGHHTEGSVALFDRASRVLFTGDHLAFFGDPVPEEGLVSEAPALRELAYRFVASLARDPAERERSRFEPFDRFVEGLKSLRRFHDATAWCTGHGAVLKEDIHGFVENLITHATEGQI